MNSRKALLMVLLGCVAGLGSRDFLPSVLAQTPAGATAAATPVARKIGSIKAINGSQITITPTSGDEVAVTVQPNARILRLEPGQTDLKTAAPIQLQELKVGDTIRVRGTVSDDGKTFAALEVLLITRSAVAAMSDQMRQDWQKRGVGGLVDSIDSATGIIHISTPGLAGKRTVDVHTSKETVIRRYANGSIKFEDARPSALSGIHTGDQLRARGDRTSDGAEITAQEVVTGSFPRLDATIQSVDAGAGTITVQDLQSKKSLKLRITADSQLHRIPAETAQMFGAIVKRMTAAAAAGASGNSAAAAPPSGANGAGGSPGGAGAGGRMGGGMRGLSEFQRGLDQAPIIAVTDLHKGDAVAILAAGSTSAGDSTVVKLFAGVEPILEAAPSASQAMMLAPWSLGGPPGGDTGNQ